MRETKNRPPPQPAPGDLSGARAEPSGPIGELAGRGAKNASWPWLNRSLPPTRWSLVARLKSNAQPVSGTAAGEFCQGYWYPLYSFLRHSGYREADAQDHVQSFLASLLDSNLLASADPAQGRLRNFLITLLTRHISAYRKRQRAQKRGGGIPAIPLDWSVAEAAYQRQGTKLGSPEEAYRHALATQLVAEGISTVQSHYAAAGQQSLCEELLPALEGPLPDGTFDALATRLNLRPGTVRAAAVRMRARFRLAVRESAAPLLGLPVGPALDAELREIFCGSAQPTGL